MDDDSIKIEAVRGVARSTRMLPRATSSNDSPHSTPVHARRPSLRKKRVKPLDWKNKGAYRAVDDAHSSDASFSPVNGHGISTVFDKPAETPDEKLETPIVVAAIPPEPKLPDEPQEQPKQELKQPLKSNGLENKVLKSKAFRIGSAKRVSESASGLVNGDVGATTRARLLLAGDGDPDFGTPV